MSTEIPCQRETPDAESATDAYALRFAGPVGAFFLETQLASVLRALPTASGCRILDVGGGHGQLCAPLVERGYDVTVLGSKDACRERLDRLIGPDRYTFHAASLLEMPFSSKCFDIVLAFRLLPHLRDWRCFLAELCRVSKGSVLFDYPERRSVNWVAGPLFFLKSAIENDTRPYRCFRRREIESALAECEYRIDETNAQFLLPMALHRLIRSEHFSRGVERAARRIGATPRLGSPVIVSAKPIPESAETSR